MPPLPLLCGVRMRQHRQLLACQMAGESELLAGLQEPLWSTGQAVVAHYKWQLPAIDPDFADASKLRVCSCVVVPECRQLRRLLLSGAVPMHCQARPPVLRPMRWLQVLIAALPRSSKRRALLNQEQVRCSLRLQGPACSTSASVPPASSCANSACAWHAALLPPAAACCTACAGVVVVQQVPAAAWRQGLERNRLLAAPLWQVSIVRGQCLSSSSTQGHCCCRAAATKPLLLISRRSARPPACRDLASDVAYASQADVLLGVHGHSLVNAFMMRRHSSVLELRPFGHAGRSADRYMKVRACHVVFGSLGVRA